MRFFVSLTSRSSPRSKARSRLRSSTAQTIAPRAGEEQAAESTKSKNAALGLRQTTALEPASAAEDHLLSLIGGQLQVDVLELLAVRPSRSSSSPGLGQRGHRQLGEQRGRMVRLPLHPARRHPEPSRYATRQREREREREREPAGRGARAPSSWAVHRDTSSTIATQIGELLGLVEIVGGEQDRLAEGSAANGSSPRRRAAHSGSKPVVGSSRKISSGSPTSASAKSTNPRSCPPDRRPAAHIRALQARRARAPRRRRGGSDRSLPSGAGPRAG